MPPRMRRTATIETVVEKPEDMLAIKARRLTQMCDMFWCPTEILALAKKLDTMSSAAELNLRSTANDKTKQLLRLVDELNKLDPELMTRLTSAGTGAGPALMRDARKQLSSGVTNAKAEDMRKVKENIGKWWNWSTPMPDMDEKENRGLNHEGCAYMLSEPSLNWANTEDQLQFMKFGNPAMEASAWPRYLRLDGVYDPLHSSRGLLMGPLMIKAGRAILLSPQIANNTRLDAPGAVSTTVGMGARGKRRKGIVGIAKAYQITEVTTAFIAYTAVVVRHALTSDETFSELCGGFDYVEYYTQLREYMDHPRFKRRATVLLAYWNEHIFSDCKVISAGASTSRRNNGTLAELDAELEAEEEENAGANRGAEAGASGEHGGN
ncbi:hypothetical protein FRC12_005898 [Ceratobasidium sp. 428]|nr:hypothetical protein FRC12_005898 [Ceratobasidium sp. 428]